jgi:putative phosphoribosyl transferase
MNVLSIGSRQAVRLPLTSKSSKTGTMLLCSRCHVAVCPWLMRLLNLFVVRKLGLPGQRELAMGAIGSGGVRVLNDEIVNGFGVPSEVIDQVTREEQAELERREATYREGRPPFSLKDKIVILVDDGLATGSTMKAAVQAVRAHQPARIVVAVPVGAPETCREFEDIADVVICARTPEPFSAVGLWYRDFSQTTDEEVRDLLQSLDPYVERRD